MDKDPEIERESRKFRRWKRLSWLGRLFRFGTILRTDTGQWPNMDEEAPLAELERLARDGLNESPPMQCWERGALERAMILLSAVAQADGVITDEEIDMVRHFIVQQGPSDLSPDEKEALLAKFRKGVDNFMQLRNEVFLLKKVLTHSQARVLAETMFRLAYSGGLQMKETHNATDIATRLGLAAGEIRLAQMNAKKDAEKDKLNGK
ncbi:MAG: TerB family tellurite resistance protein [Calditrichota bacterium]